MTSEEMSQFWVRAIALHTISMKMAIRMELKCSGDGEIDEIKGEMLVIDDDKAFLEYLARVSEGVEVED